MESTLQIKKGINAKKFFPNTRHIITYAFSIGPEHFFKFDDHLNIPYQRALSSLVFYKEVELNIDRDFLKAHVEAIDAILLSAKINIFKIKELNDLLMQRMKLPKDPELMYKLASVIFFSDRENPEVYEFEYGKKKIDFWKQHTSMTDFFLSMPLQELIPYLKHAGENLEAFSQLIEKTKSAHSDKVLQELSEEQKMNWKDSAGSVPVVTI